MAACGQCVLQIRGCATLGLVEDSVRRDCLRDGQIIPNTCLSLITANNQLRK